MTVAGPLPIGRGEEIDGRGEEVVGHAPRVAGVNGARGRRLGREMLGEHHHAPRAERAAVDVEEVDAVKACEVGLELFAVLSEEAS